MYKLIVAYKINDLFSEWNYVSREEDDLYAFEYRITKLRYNHNNPEYFKKLVFSKLSDTTRKTIQELGDLEFDALVFVEEAKDTVWLRYQDETIKLEDFRTKEEQKIEHQKMLEQKFCKNRYIENREELDEFLTALEVFNDHADFDEIEVLTYLKEDVKTTKNFPILLAYHTYEEYNISYDYNEHHHRFTLVDDSLGR